MALEYPDDLRYLDSHEYARLDGEIATVGLSAFAVDELGDIVFVELPEEGDALALKGAIGAVESVKAASDVYSPVAGTVIEVNKALLESPELLNEDPYGEAWLIKVRIDNWEDTLEETLSADEYQANVEGED
ncbi:MAG: glycine cleavage system protein GcvH [Cyanobacteriota bacterium]|jgi:glycine cleavage system H protein